MSRTLDSFLGGKIKLFQPTQGYRAGIDPIFLAASLKVSAENNVLDVGAGAGVASLALAAREPLVKLTCLEILPEIAHLASNNMQANNLSESIEVICGDVMNPPAQLVTHTFDHVMTNPPYYEYDRFRPSPVPGRAQAMIETANLENWLDFCCKMLKPKGTLTLIHRTERLGEIINHLEPRMGSMVVYPLWASKDKPARRVLIQAHKGKKGELTLLPGMVLHNNDNKYTAEAEAVLRDGVGIDL